MHSGTHAAMGLYLYMMFERLAQIDNSIIFFFILIGSTLLPDIDYKGSLLGRKVKAVGEFFNHRGFIHTVYALAIFAVLVQVIWHNYIYTLAFSLGYASHLFLDMFSKSGLKPFWFGKKIYGNIKTGGFMDNFFFVFLITVFILMYFNIL